MCEAWVGATGRGGVAAGEPREMVELRGEVVDLRAPLLLALLLAFAHLGGGKAGRQQRGAEAGAGERREGDALACASKLVAISRRTPSALRSTAATYAFRA